MRGENKLNGNSKSFVQGLAIIIAAAAAGAVVAHVATDEKKRTAVITGSKTLVDKVAAFLLKNKDE